MSTSAEPEAGADTQEKPPINLQVKVETTHPCERQVVVTIPRTEVDRYMGDAFDQLAPEAQVPGFRAGRAPRKLVEKQFRDRVSEQVKGSLLMDSLGQVTDSQDFSPISEPDFDYESIEIPEKGDFVFQFTVEVRPEFDTPKWRGLKFVKPVEDITDENVSESLNRVMARYGSWEATDEAAAIEDRVSVNLTFTNDGKTLSELEEEGITLRKSLSFSDGVIEDFGKLLTGAKEGDTVKAKVVMGESISDEELAGKTVDASVEVVEIQKLETPEISDSILEELGDFESEEELKEFIRDSLTRQADYRTQQAVRSAVVELLTDSAKFELPKDLVRRQTSRELERRILELRRSGFDNDMIRSYVNSNSRNQQAVTENALREHFILEQIAEEEKVDVDSGDYDEEIRLIAQQSEMTERSVRARLEKNGQMDALRNQIVERKVIDLVVSEAKVSEKKVKEEDEAATDFAIYHSVLAAKNLDAIPEAKYDDNRPAGTEDDSAGKDTKDKD